jgi:hypothetical protein
VKNDDPSIGHRALLVTDIGHFVFVASFERQKRALDHGNQPDTGMETANVSCN